MAKEPDAKALLKAKRLATALKANIKRRKDQASRRKAKPAEAPLRKRPEE